MHIPRILPIKKELERKSLLLLGPRQTGKSTLIRHQVRADHVYNLLHADVFQRLSARPSLIRESLTPKTKLFVIDEIQKLPSLMDEVHSMIEEHRIRFLLTGSSARKIKRSHTSLLGGRAAIRRLFPFVFPELNDFNLTRVLHFGSIPSIYLSRHPWQDLKDYVGTYLKEEILAEALTRKIESFSRFLVTAAVSNTRILNFEEIGRDAQVPSRTVREYFKLLEDTLMGSLLEPFRKGKSRKTVAKAKFYFFDIGVANALTDQKEFSEHSDVFGRAFEHLIFNELNAFRHYYDKSFPLTFWQNYSRQEVDFILGDSIAIEVKSTQLAHEKHLKGLRAIADTMKLKRAILVTRDPQKRKVGNVQIIPWHMFLEDLWAGRMVP